MAPIYHITSRAEIEEASKVGHYLPKNFDQDTFIHCSYPHQISTVANFLFRGRDDLVLLKIDRERLSCEVIDENLEGGPEKFPHIYGPLPLDAVSEVLKFPPREDGTFQFPEKI